MAIVESVKHPFGHQTTSAGSSSLKSFEEIYKTSYSHGLEAIYAIEKIDLNSIRRISEQPGTKASAKPKKQELPTPHVASVQLEFDFGDQYRGWMESFVVREPIQVLGLSRHAEKSLLTNGKHVLRDLIGVDLHSFVFFKGMGQGHIDEIQNKLSQYLNGRALHQCYTVDFVAWLRGWNGFSDRKKAFVCMQPYNLESLFPLSMAESLEVGRLPLDKRQEWTQEVFGELRSKLGKEITADLKKIVDVFVRPWIRNRMGMATKLEILERLQKVSDDPAITNQVFDFLCVVNGNNQFPLNPFLHQVDDNLYCADASAAETYRLILQVAHSYFYKSSICYTLPHLVQLIARELACCWQGVSIGFMEKSLRQSSHFHVRKQSDSGLMVSLARNS